jgi:hypothetical protein
MSRWFGADEWCDLQGVTRLGLRLLLDVIVLALLVAVHQRRTRRADYVFTFGALNVITFVMCFLLRKVPMDLGMGLGLFAVFGILRYRTETLGFRELTYLFVVIGVAVLNASANRHISVAELVLVNVAVCATTIALDGAGWTSRNTPRPLLYDRIDLLAPARRADLLDDLSQRIGARVTRVDVVRMDLVRDLAELAVYVADAPPRPTG